EADVTRRPAFEQGPIGLVLAPHVKHVDADPAVEGRRLAGEAPRDLLQHEIVVLPEAWSRDPTGDTRRLAGLCVVRSHRSCRHAHVSPLRVAAPARPPLPDQI